MLAYVRENGTLVLLLAYVREHHNVRAFNFRKEIENVQPANGRANKFNPPANIPQEIALKWADGLPCQSPYNGDQVRFTLTDGTSWFCDPDVAEKIRSLGVVAGEVFRVTRCEVARGNRRSVEWNVARTPEAGSGLPSAPPAAAPSTNAPREGNHAAQNHPNPPTIEGAIRSSLLTTGKLAVDAALEIEAYARDRGMQLQFDAPTLQDIWVSAFIQTNRNGGR
jgi:hypothetical protein